MKIMRQCWDNQHRYVAVNMLLVLCVFRSVMTDVIEITEKEDNSQCTVLIRTDITRTTKTRSGSNCVNYSLKPRNDFTTKSGANSVSILLHL